MNYGKSTQVMGEKSSKALGSKINGTWQIGPTILGEMFQDKDSAKTERV